MARAWGVLLVLAGLVCWAQPAAAQSRQLPRFAVGVGAGISDPLHGDFGFLAPSWDVSIRGAAGRRVATEVFLSEWRHTDATESVDVPILGPTGAITGRIGRLSQSTRRTAWTLGANVLPTFSRGRVTVSAGGGAGFIMFGRRYHVSQADCVGSAATACGGYENSHASGSISAQLAAGIDVALTKHVSTFGQWRFVVPLSDPGSGHSAAVGGIRIGR